MNSSNHKDVGSAATKIQRTAQKQAEAVHIQLPPATEDLKAALEQAVEAVRNAYQEIKEVGLGTTEDDEEAQDRGQKAAEELSAWYQVQLEDLRRRQFKEANQVFFEFKCLRDRMEYGNLSKRTLEEYEQFTAVHNGREFELRWAADQAGFDRFTVLFEEPSILAKKYIAKVKEAFEGFGSEEQKPLPHELKKMMKQEGVLEQSGDDGEEEDDEFEEGEDGDEEDDEYEGGEDGEEGEQGPQGEEAHE